MTGPGPSLVEAAAGALSDALRTVEGLRVYDDLGAVIDPPGAIVGPPSLVWEAFHGAPSSARFLVVVAAAFDERALPRLWDLVPRVALAIEAGVPAAVVRRADPGVWAGGGPDLPSYELQIEVAL